MGVYPVYVDQLVLLQNPKAPSREQNGSAKSEYAGASQHDLGWRAQKTFLVLPAAGVVFSLDSPLRRLGGRQAVVGLATPRADHLPLPLERKTTFFRLHAFDNLFEASAKVMR
jgi:hypothetical protein